MSTINIDQGLDHLLFSILDELVLNVKFFFFPGDVIIILFSSF